MNSENFPNLRPRVPPMIKFVVTKAQKTFKYKVKTNLNQLVSLMMENDLNIEKNNN